MQATNQCPDFFVVGAPRCGTTAISRYLAKNPHICFSRPKEPHFFSIIMQEKPDADLHNDYLELFFQHCNGTYQATGEGSVSYLYYPRAIERIQQLNPQARFIVMARNPIDMIHSYHARLLAILDEDVEDFATAWGLQEARARGEQLPGHCRTPYLLQYAEIGRIGNHVEQLFQTAGRENCHVVLFDDFISDTLGCYRQVLDFIRVDYDGQTEFPPQEVSKFYRYRWLHLLLKRPPMRVVKYTLNIEQRARRKGRKKSRVKRIRKWLISKNTVIRKRPPLDQAMRRQLQETFAEDIEKLGRLLDRDLSHWR
jgi:hypothetical protein